jgi:hypothetical protein
MFVKLACAISSFFFFFFFFFWVSVHFFHTCGTVLVIRVATDVHLLDLTNTNEQFLAVQVHLVSNLMLYIDCRGIFFYYVQQ